MTTLREAATQALEALEEYQSKGAPFWSCDAAVDALRAALAEAVQEPTCNGMPAIEGPLSRSQRMRDAGFTRRPRGWVKDGDGPVQEPVANEIHGCHGGEGSTLPEVSQQEPVAWMISDPKNPKMRFVEWQKETKSYKGEWIKTPLYTAPPQRKPLTGEEVLDIARTFGAQPWPPGSCVAFARAVERAHGIGATHE